MRIKIAIFGSGSGTNAENIIQYFQGNSSIEVALVISNRSDAYILERAKRHNIPVALFPKSEFCREDIVIPTLNHYKIDFVVLAGFLLQIPTWLVRLYPNRIINIHPALLPKFGGKGMYGDRVHQSVVESAEKESGITIHYVDEHYDSGAIIFQATCVVLSTDTFHDVASNVHQLEYAHFPHVIEETVREQFL